MRIYKEDNEQVGFRLGDLSKFDKNLLKKKSIRFDDLTEEDIGLSVYKIETREEVSGYDGWGDEEYKDVGYLIEGKVTDVKHYPKVDRPGEYYKSAGNSVTVEYEDGSTSDGGSRGGGFYWTVDYAYSESDAKNLMKESEKITSSQELWDSISVEEVKSLAKKAGFTELTKEYNSDTYGENAVAELGCSTNGHMIFLHLYLRPSDGGHIRNGSTYEIGYLPLGNRIKRHYGAFSMPRNVQSWLIHPKDVSEFPASQFVKDCKALKEIYDNLDSMTDNQISETIYKLFK